MTILIKALCVIFGIVAIIIVLSAIISSFRIVGPDEIALKIKHGRIDGVWGSGWHWLFDGFWNDLKKFKKGWYKIDLPPMEFTVKNGTSIEIDPVIYFKFPEQEALLIQIFEDGFPTQNQEMALFLEGEVRQILGEIIEGRNWTDINTSRRALQVQLEQRLRQTNTILGGVGNLYPHTHIRARIKEIKNLS